MSNPHKYGQFVTASAPATVAKSACWRHKIPMSLWLSSPSIAYIRASVLDNLPFPAHSALFTFLWTISVTAGIILFIAIRATYQSRRAKPGPRRLRFERWEDEEKADVVMEVAIASGRDEELEVGSVD